MGINTPGATWVQTWETTGAEGFRRIPAPEAREIPPPARSSSLRLGIMCFSESEAGRAGAGGQAGAQAPPCSPERAVVSRTLPESPSAGGHFFGLWPNSTNGCTNHPPK